MNISRRIVRKSQSLPPGASLRLTAFTAICFTLALPLLGAYPSHESFVPGVSRIVVPGGGTSTTLWITNANDSGADVALWFVPAVTPAQPPRAIHVRIAAGSTYRADLGDELVSGDATGALRLESSLPVAAEARVSNHGGVRDDVGTVINALPAELAMGLHQSSILHASAADSRYRLYAVETTGAPLVFAATAMSGQGKTLGTKRLSLSGRETRSWDLTEVFGSGLRDIAALRLEGVEGNGRIVAVGIEISNRSHDLSTHEMTLPLRAGQRFGALELATYIVVGLALIVAAIYNLKKRR